MPHGGSSPGCTPSKYYNENFPLLRSEAYMHCYEEMSTTIHRSCNSTAHCIPAPGALAPRVLPPARGGPRARPVSRSFDVTIPSAVLQLSNWPEMLKLRRSPSSTSFRLCIDTFAPLILMTVLMFDPLTPSTAPACSFVNCRVKWHGTNTRGSSGWSLRFCTCSSRTKTALVFPACIRKLVRIHMSSGHEQGLQEPADRGKEMAVNIVRSTQVNSCSNMVVQR